MPIFHSSQICSETPSSIDSQTTDPFAHIVAVYEEFFLDIPVGVCITVRHCRFRDNIGYAIRYLYNYINNRLGELFEAADAPEATVLVEDTYFENNRGIQLHAADPDSGCHVWICDNVINLIVARCQFNKTDSQAISIKGAWKNLRDDSLLVERATIYGCKFLNTQQSSYEGTAVSGELMRHFSIRSSMFSSNAGREGGAVRFSDIRDPSIMFCTFVNNRATIGGAIYIKSKIPSSKLRVTVIDSSVFVNNVGSGLGQSLYNNEDIVLRNIYIESDEETVGYHLHSECGTFEASNLTVSINRRGKKSPADGKTSDGLFVASSKIRINNGWRYECPSFLNAGMFARNYNVCDYTIAALRLSCLDCYNRIDFHK